MTELQKWGQLAVIVTLGSAAAWFVVRTHSQNFSRQAILVRVFAFNLFVVGVGIGAGSYFASFYPPIFAMTATGMLTFFGFIGHSLNSKPDARIEDRDIRIAIASSITIMYVAVVGFGIFVVQSGQPDPVAQSLLTSFSTVVGTVIAFYFGTSAFLERKANGAHVQETKIDAGN